jgi:ergothioneine biosynthesis protein EgtB
MSLNWLEFYKKVRAASEAICRPLQKEDYVVQPVVDVSPPKWHLGHTTWFWETFILQPYRPGYKVFNAEYNYVFNSYYETIGARVIRTDRGNLSRPSVDDVYAYRAYVDKEMEALLAELDTNAATTSTSGQRTAGPAGQATPGDLSPELILLGLNHEQQHQELLWTDIKFILGHNPLFPAYEPGGAIDAIHADAAGTKKEPAAAAGITLPGDERTGAVSGAMLAVPAGMYDIGYAGDGFCFDNELARHRVYLADYQIAASLVTNGEFISFIEAGGYRNFVYWHAEGWDWVKTRAIEAPLYWHNIDGVWHQYSLGGLRQVPLEEPVTHISYYEAAAFAAWKEMRLPTEFEWEAAAAQFNWGARWEWTGSAYLAYPGFVRAAGAIGEYNGKFMINQMVLRGASVATPAGHSRATYRNFFHANLRWQYTGIRLAL